MEFDLSFQNAKVRALKSELLSKQTIEYLTALPNLQEVIIHLTGTAYKVDIEEALLQASGVRAIEDGLKRNLVRSMSKLLATDDERATKYVDIVLGKYDVQNIKTLLRGKHANASTEEIVSSLIPAGKLKESTLAELAKERSVKDVIDTLKILGHSLADPLLKSFSSYIDTDNLAELEISLDKHHYAHARARLKGDSFNDELLLGVIRREIDFINIMTLIKLLKQTVDAETMSMLFLMGGKHLNYENFVALHARNNMRDLIEGFSASPYYEALAGKIEEYEQHNAVSRIERGFEEFIIQKVTALFASDPLSVGMLISYVAVKINEIVNLRIIATGKDMDMPSEVVREGLILV